MRVVVDTNVFVSAILTPTGPPAQILDLILTRQITLLLSPSILTEYQEVLKRKKIGLKNEKVEDFLEFVRAYAENISDVTPKISLPDPEDLPFLACALEGKADFLITGNKKDFPDSICRPVKVVSPAAFLIVFSETRRELS